MKYVLEIHHYQSATLNSGHPEHDLRACIKANTLWSLLREAKKRHFEYEFYIALERHIKYCL